MKKWITGFVGGLAAGAMLMVTVPALADTVKSYMLVKAEYEVEVSGVAYQQEELPFLNYEGSTYVPLRAVGDLLGARVDWQQEAHKVSIEPLAPALYSNEAFRVTKVQGSNGLYIINGQARVFEGTVSYKVTDGHNYLQDGYVTATEGAPGWGDFQIAIDLMPDSLPLNGTLLLELYEESMKDGSAQHLLSIPLEQFGEDEQ